MQGAGGRAVEPEFSRLPVLTAFRAGADIHLALHALQRREDGEAAIAASARHVAIGGAAQAAAGRQEGDRFHEIGLARPVLPRQHDMPAVERQRQTRIIAEIRELEAGKGNLVRHGLRARAFPAEAESLRRRKMR